MTYGPIGDPVSHQPIPGQGGPQPVALTGQPNDGDPVFQLPTGEQVTLSELQRGYMRQADYTQKTQGLAAQRAQVDAASQLVAALQADPLATIAELAQATGVDLRELTNTGQQPGIQSQVYDPAVEGIEGEEGLDVNNPLVQMMLEMKAQLDQLTGGVTQLEDRQVNAQLDAELAQVAQLAEQMGIPYDEDELIAYANEREIPDVQAAFRAMAFDHLTGQPPGGSQLPRGMEQWATEGFPGNAQVQPDYQPPQASVPREIRQAVSQQTPRSGLNAASQPRQPQPQPENIGQAFAQTLSELGVTDWSQVDMGQ